MRADLDGTCPVCDDQIYRGQVIVPRQSGWVHEGCVSGADDE